MGGFTRAVPADLRFSRGAPDAAGNVRQAGADFWYNQNIPFAVARGVYFFSNWSHARYVEHSYEVDAPFLTKVPYVLAAENDRLIAEHMAGTAIIKETSMAKWWVTEMCKRNIDLCLQFYGGYGFMEEYPICRAYRDARIQTIFAGTTEIMKIIIAKSMGL